MGHKVHDDDNDDGDRKAVDKRAHLKVRLTWAKKATLAN